MKIHPTVLKYVIHCGEMGPAWGVSRSVAQIYALLYLSDRALTADEIVQALSIARSNVGNGLKELQGWGLVKVKQELGDRRDHFEALDDVWESFGAIIRARKRREIEPSVRAIRECLDEAKTHSRDVSKITVDRLASMLAFVELMDAWGERAARLSPKNLRRLSQLADAVFRMVE